MPKQVQFTPDDELEICRLYTSQRLTVADIARLKGVSNTPILRVLRDKDVPMRAQGNETKTTRNTKIMDMKDAGFTDADIAKSLGISRQRVNAITARGY